MPAKIEIVHSDITGLRVDAIVNAANEALQLGSGVAGAIRTRGGPTIQAECDRIGHCDTGEAVTTGAGNLPARWVIHAVGPVWRGGEFGEEMQLASAVLAALKRAEEVGARSIALPAISAGIYGFPLEKAAEISVAAARAFAGKAAKVERIIFALFDDVTFRAFQNAAGQS
jgi:O-acetyl-ADP-ribose deacetylase (regulator of RNase III)